MQERKVYADKAFVVRTVDSHVCFFCKKECSGGSLMLSFSKIVSHGSCRVMWCSGCDSRIRKRRGIPLRDFKKHDFLEDTRKKKKAEKMREARLKKYSYRGGMFDD